MDKLLEFFKLATVNLANFYNLGGITSISPGWLFGAFSAVAVSLYGLSLGRTRAVVSLLSIYVAFVFIRLFPYSDKIDQITNSSLALYWIEVGMFLGAYLVVFIIFTFSFVSRRLSSAEFSLFGVIIISILQLGFLISIIFSILPEDLVIKWSLGFYNYFATQQALFFWAIGPLPILPFLGKK